MCTKCPMQLFDVNNPVNVTVRTRGAEKTLQTCLTGRQALEICQQMEDNEFVNSLLTQYARKRRLTGTQWDWIAYLAESHYRQTVKERQTVQDDQEGAQAIPVPFVPVLAQRANTNGPKLHVLTSELRWHADDKTFVAEASDLQWKSRPAVVTVESHKTGNKKLFKWKGTKKDNEGDILYHDYSDETGLTLRVFND